MITPTKYQPILFHQGEEPASCLDCGECDTWTQKMFESDYVSFQFEIAPCKNAENVVQNPQFIYSTNWVKIGDPDGVVLYGSGRGLYRPDVGIAQTLPSVPGGWYMATIELYVKNPSGGRIEVTGAGEFEAYSRIIEFPIQLSTGPGNGIFITRTNDGLFGPENYIRIESVYLIPIQMPSVLVKDMTGNTIEVLSNASFEVPYMNIEYQPNATVVDEGVFYFHVMQACGDATQLPWTSERIEIVPKDDCLMQVMGCSTNNIYKGNFRPYMRLDAVLLADTAPVYEINTQRKTTGSWRINYGRMALTYTFKTDYLPEHVRNFVYMFRMFQMVAIKKGTGNQKGYFAYEDPSAPEFKPSNDEMGSITIPFVFKEDLIETIFNGECNVVLPPRVLGERSTDTIIYGDGNAINA